MSDETPPNPTEDRINSIVAQRDANADRVAQQDAQIKALNAQLNALSDQILSRATPPAPSPTPKKESGGNLPAGETPDIAGLVQSAVRDALAPMVEERKADREADALRQKQAVSYEKAITMFPELDDPSSAMAQTVNKIANNRPDLRMLDDAPVVLALTARGVLVDEKREITVTNQAKNQAKVTRPSPASNRVVSTPPGGEAAEVARQVLESAGEVGQVGSGASRFADMFRAGLQQASDSE